MWFFSVEYFIKVKAFVPFSCILLENHNIENKKLPGRIPAGVLYM